MFRFTIRDVLWLTTLIAVMLGSFLLLVRMNGRRAELIREIEQEAQIQIRASSIQAAIQKASPDEN
jgi:cytochrome c-type biogenesis protein CcmH/NrfF